MEQAFVCLIDIIQLKTIYTLIKKKPQLCYLTINNLIPQLTIKTILKMQLKMWKKQF